VSYTTLSEQRKAPKGAREAFPEIAWEDLKVSQEEGLVDMIIGKDNPEWMPFAVREEPPLPTPILGSLRLQRWFSWITSNLEVVNIKTEIGQ
jgi:hypothetical protein